ncbi:MAG: hypothetical protein AAGE84_12385 [Cyanobacteria bacterium P01_G01_bin.39]
MIYSTEFDQIKLIAAGYGLLGGTLTITIEDILKWLIKSQKIDLAKLLYKSFLFGSVMAVAWGTASAVLIASADVPLDSINKSTFFLTLTPALSNTITFLWEEFSSSKKSD